MTDAHTGTLRQHDSLCVSIVCAIDGARFVVVAATEQECLVQIASYVADHATLQLWPSSARHVHGLLAAGDLAAAVADYFQHANERWEAEWLVTARLDPGSCKGAWSGMVPLSGHFAPSNQTGGSQNGVAFDMEDQ